MPEINPDQLWMLVVDDEKEVVEEGGAGILFKPLKISDLKGAISRVTHAGGTERGM